MQLLILTMGRIRIYTYISLALLLLLSPVICLAQDTSKDPKIDSLETLLSQVIDLETKQTLIAEIIETTKFKNPELSLSYTRKLLRSGEGLEANTKTMYAKRNLARVYQLSGKLDSSILLLKEIVHESKVLNPQDQQKQLWRAYMFLGNAFDIQGNVDSTYYYFKAGYDLKQIVKDSAEVDHIITTFAVNLGNFYYDKGDSEEALRYYSEAVESCSRSGNKNNLGVLYNNIGNIYSEKLENEKAIEYYNKSIALRQEIGNSIGMLYVIPNLIERYLVLEEYDSLFKKGYWAKEIADELDIPMFRIMINSFVARGEAQYGRPHKSIELLNEIKPLVDESKVDVSVLLQYYKASFYTYLENGEFRKAERFFNLKNEIYKETGWEVFELDDFYDKMILYNALGLKDSVSVAINELSKATKKKMDVQVKELGKIEASFTNLENEQKVELLQKEKIALEAVSSRNKIAAFAALTIAFLTIFFLYRNHRQKQIISKKNKELSILNNTKDQIFSIIGHDLKKPVLAFRGLHEKFSYLINNNKHEKLLKFSQSIDDEAVQLNKLTDNLLSWALLQKDILSISEEHLNLSGLTEEVIALYRNFAENKSISFIHNVPDIEVLTDRHALSTILRNLIDNAIKYTNEGGAIEIHAHKENDLLSLQIKDSGEGIEKEKLRDIFMLSKDKSTSGTNSEKGTGLGLHIVKELVEKCKGKIAVESRVNEGTIFTLSLPI